MTLIRVAAGSVMGMRPHVGGNVLDCRVHKVVRGVILTVRFRRNSEVCTASNLLNTAKDHAVNRRGAGARDLAQQKPRRVGAGGDGEL